MENPWAVHQARVTLDFARRSKIVTWPVGGLNYHLEHHLFPTICHIHYPAITKIVQEACRDHGINYAEHNSFRTGLAAHYRWLRRMGMPATEAKKELDADRTIAERYFGKRCRTFAAI